MLIYDEKNMHLFIVYQFEFYFFLFSNKVSKVVFQEDRRKNLLAVILVKPSLKVPTL